MNRLAGRALALVVLLCAHPVAAQLIVFERPTSATVARVGDSIEVAWMGLPDGTSATLEFSRDDGRTWRVIAWGVTGSSYTWCADGRSTSAARFRLRYDRMPQGGRSALTLRHSSSVSDATFSPDGATIATFSLDRALRLWNAITGELLWMRGSEMPIGLLSDQASRPRVLFSPNGSRIAVTTANPYGISTELFSVEKKRHVAFLTGLGWPARFLDDSTILSAQGVYRIDSLAFVRTFPTMWPKSTGLGILPDGRTVVTTSCHGGVIDYVDMETGANAGRFVEDRHPRPAGAVSPDGGLLASIRNDGYLEVRSTAAMKLLAQGPIPIGPLAECPIVDVSFSPSGVHLGHTRVDGRAAIVDAVSLANRVELDGHTGRVASIDFSPDGNRVVTAGEDGNVFVTTFRDGETSSVSEPFRLDVAAHEAVPSRLEFDTLIVPRGVETRPWSLINRSSVPLPMEALGFDGGSSVFALLGGPSNEARVVAPGERFEIAVTLSATTPGVHDARLLVRIGGDTVGHPVRGIAAALPFEVAPTVVNFGFVPWGSARDSVLPYIVRNVDSVPRVVNVEIRARADENPFRIVEGGGRLELAAGEARSLHVRFAPRGDGGLHERVILVGYDGPGSPLMVVLQGTTHDRPTSAPVAEEGTRMMLVPNPAHRLVRIRFDQTMAGTLEVVDLLGRSIGTFECRPSLDEQTLDLGGVPPGHYLVIVRGRSGRTALPLVIERE